MKMPVRFLISCLSGMFLLVSCNQGKVESVKKDSAPVANSSGSGSGSSSNSGSSTTSSSSNALSNLNSVDLSHYISAYAASDTNELGNIFCMHGGEDGWGNYGNALSCFTIDGGWQQISLSPNRVTEASALYYDNKFFVFSGYDWMGGRTKNAFYYNFTKKSWFSFPSLNVARRMSKAALFGASASTKNHFVVIGGNNTADATAKSTFEVSGPSTGYLWTKYNLSFARHSYFGVAEIDQGVLVVGGYTGGVSPTNSVELISIDDMGIVTTTPWPSMLMERDGPSVAVVTLPNDALLYGFDAGQQVVVACGGYSQNGNTSPFDGSDPDRNCEYYNPKNGAAGAWQLLLPGQLLADGRWDAPMFSIKNKLFVAQGWSWDEQFKLDVIDLDSGLIGQSKNKINANGGDGIGGKVKDPTTGDEVAFWAGGWSWQCQNNCGQATTYVSNLTNYEPHDSFSYKNLYASYNASSLRDGDYIYICGGMTSDNAPISSCTKYNKKTGEFNYFPPLNYARARATLFKHEITGQLAIVGGASYWDAVYPLEVYDSAKNEWVVKASINSNADILNYPSVQFYLADFGFENFKVCSKYQGAPYSYDTQCALFENFDREISDPDLFYSSYGVVGGNLSVYHYIEEVSSSVALLTPSSDGKMIGTSSWVGMVGVDGTWSDMGYHNVPYGLGLSSIVDTNNGILYASGAGFQSVQAACYVSGKYIGGQFYPEMKAMGYTGCEDDPALVNVWERIFSNFWVYDYRNNITKKASRSPSAVIWPTLIQKNDGKIVSIGGATYSDLMIQNMMSPWYGEMILLKSGSFEGEWYFSPVKNLMVYDPSKDSWTEESNSVYSYLPAVAQDSTAAYLIGSWERIDYMPHATLHSFAK